MLAATNVTERLGADGPLLSSTIISSIPYQRPTSAGKGRRYQHSDTTPHLQSDHWTRDIRQRQKRHQHSKRLGAKRIARVIARSTYLLVSAHTIIWRERANVARSSQDTITSTFAAPASPPPAAHCTPRAHCRRPTLSGNLAPQHSKPAGTSSGARTAPHRTAPPLRFHAGYLHNNRPAVAAVAATATATQHEPLL